MCRPGLVDPPLAPHLPGTRANQNFDTIGIETLRGGPCTSQVTGGTGYLGAHTVRGLLAAGHRIRLLVAPGCGDDEGDRPPRRAR